MIINLAMEKTGYGQIGNNLKWYKRDAVIKPIDNEVKRIHIRKHVDLNLDVEGNAHEVEAQRYVSKSVGRIYGNQVPDMIEPPKRQTGFGGTYSGLDAIGFRFANKQNETLKSITSKYSI
jgi:hypothetical protein